MKNGEEGAGSAGASPGPKTALRRFLHSLAHKFGWYGCWMEHGFRDGHEWMFAICCTCQKKTPFTHSACCWCYAASEARSAPSPQGEGPSQPRAPRRERE